MQASEWRRMEHIKETQLLDVLLDGKRVNSMGKLFDVVEGSGKGNILEFIERRQPHALDGLDNDDKEVLRGIFLSKLYRVTDGAPYWGSCPGSIVLPIGHNSRCGFREIVVAVFWRPPGAPAWGAEGEKDWDDDLPFEVVVDIGWLEPITREEYHGTLH